MACQSWCLLLVRHADLQASAIAKLDAIAILLCLVVYDPELFKVLVVARTLKLERTPARKCRIGRAVCKGMH